MKTGIEAFGEERLKQIEKHGFTAEHHANHPEWYEKFQLVDAANHLSSPPRNPSGSYDEYFLDEGWYPDNWDKGWFYDLCRRPFTERLVIAGALLAAEYDRIEFLKQNSTS